MPDFGIKSYDTRLETFRNFISWWSDCNSISNGSIATRIIGTGALITNIDPAEAGVYGVFKMETGSTATGSAAATEGYSLSPHVPKSWHAGQGRIIFEAKVRVPTLSATAQTYSFHVGLRDQFDTLVVDDGIYFSYEHGASLLWRVHTEKNNVATTTITDITVTANQWYRLTIIVNAAATEVLFYIDGVLKATHTTNIPNDTTSSVGAGATIVKSNGTGTSIANMDYIGYDIELTTSRASSPT